MRKESVLGIQGSIIAYPSRQKGHCMQTHRQKPLGTPRAAFWGRYGMVNLPGQAELACVRYEVAVWYYDFK